MLPCPAVLPSIWVGVLLIGTGSSHTASGAKRGRFMTEPVKSQGKTLCLDMCQTPRGQE